MRTRIGKWSTSPSPPRSVNQLRKRALGLPNSRRNKEARKLNQPRASRAGHPDPPPLGRQKTAPPTTSSRSRATAAANGSRATCKDDEAGTMRRLGTDSVIPHRLKYKKFSRRGDLRQHAADDRFRGQSGDGVCSAKCSRMSRSGQTIRRPGQVSTADRPAQCFCFTDCLHTHDLLCWQSRSAIT